MVNCVANGPDQQHCGYVYILLFISCRLKGLEIITTSFVMVILYLFFIDCSNLILAVTS